MFLLDSLRAPGTVLSQRALQKRIRRPEFFASVSTHYLCKTCLAFLGLLFLILKLGSFRKSVVRSVLAVKTPILVSQYLLQSNTFLILIFFPLLCTVFHFSTSLTYW